MLTDCLAACAHLTITISELERDIGENNGRKARFFIPPLHSTPLLGGVPVGISVPLWYGKTRMVSTRWWKNFEDTFIRFIHERDGRTDGQTDRRRTDTAWQQRSRLCIASRGKNRRFHVPQPTFLFPLETPLRLSRNMLHGWKDNSMPAKRLTACTYLSSIVSELYDAKVNA